MARKDKTKSSKQETTHILSDNREDVNGLLLSAFDHHQSGALDKAQELYAYILNHHTDHPDALHLLGVVSYQKGDLETAERLIKKAIVINPHAHEYKSNLGNVHRKLGNNEEAISCYRDALELKPDFAEAYNNLGACLRGTSKMHEALDCYKKALEIKPDNDATHYNLGNIFRETGEIDQALLHYHEAVRLNPYSVEAYRCLGNTYWDKGDFGNAIVCYRKITELEPESLDTQLSLSRLLRDEGHIHEAIESCRKAIGLKGDPADAYHLLGTMYQETGEYHDAGECFRKELEIRPENPQANNSFGMALQHTGKPDDAIPYYRKAIELDPYFAEAYSNLGIALHDTGKPEDAIICYKKAITLDSEYAKAYNNMGSAFLEMHKAEEAIEFFRQATHIKPDFIEAYNNMGIALKDLKRYEDSLISLQKALAINPFFIDAHINSGNTLSEQCRFTEALSCYHKAFEINPKSIEALTNIAYIFSIQGKMKESLSYYQKALEMDPDHATAHSNFLFSLHYQDLIDFRELSEQHKSWGKQVARTLTRNTSPHANDMTPGRRLRIGYVSPDFRKHSVAYFVEPILASHDESAFEVFCYSDVAAPDETTERMQILVNNWRDISRLRDEHLERMIREDKIDILIDLAGHTAKNRLLLFAREPAPIQVSYLGYPNTTGLTNMHYRITDVLADPDGKTDHLFTERLVRLPKGFLSYSPPMETPDVAQPPMMRSGKVTFGSFNNRSKITSGVVKIWSDILKRLPGSRLVLKSKVLSDPETQKALLDMFVQEGVGSEQVEFYGSIPTQYDHLALYNSVDVALDTFPYNGTTTTCEALWMGVPVIVLEGDVHMSRVGVSILTNAGMEEFIADTPEDYVKKAVDLANDPERLLQLRDKQRNIMANSPLMDAQVFTQYLEKEYRKIWAQWCSLGNMHIIDARKKPEPVAPISVNMSSSKEFARALNQQGEDLYNAGRMEDALCAFHKALEIDPDCVGAINNLGALYWQQGDAHKAILFFQKVLILDPCNEDATYNLHEIKKVQLDTIDEPGAESADHGLNQSDDLYLRINLSSGFQVCVPPSIESMTPYILLEQEDWFEEEIHYIREALQEGMNVIDIGANYGLYTLSMSKVIGPSGRVWAFEPTSLTADFLRTSISTNQMTNITLIQVGLSDKKGTARISLNPNPELNSITNEPDSGGEYETVELLSLDDCENNYGLDKIDFIKLDAEGQEHNIIMGGKHFLMTQSPLIMFELKHEDIVNTELINDFSELGYQLYHLIPGLNVLAPIDLTKPFDPYQLNLFCCNEDRARMLEEQGLLIIKCPLPKPISSTSLWQLKLQAMPYFKLLMGSWASVGKDKTIPGWDYYAKALNYYVMANDQMETNHSRYACLNQSIIELCHALESEKNISRLLTYSRVLSELGRRQDSLHVAESILNMLESEQTLALTEPFLSPSKRFDHINPSDISTWVIASVLVHWEKSRAFSSFYTGNSSLNNLEVIKQLEYRIPEMERRRQLIRIRFGLQDGPMPDPILSEKSKDNNNPGLWMKRSFTRWYQPCSKL
jgi:FkbM family methyltransferase